MKKGCGMRLKRINCNDLGGVFLIQKLNNKIDIFASEKINNRLINYDKEQILKYYATMNIFLMLLFLTTILTATEIIHEVSIIGKSMMFVSACFLAFMTYGQYRIIVGKGCTYDTVCNLLEKIVLEMWQKRC